MEVGSPLHSTRCADTLQGWNRLALPPPRDQQATFFKHIDPLCFLNSSGPNINLGNVSSCYIGKLFFLLAVLDNSMSNHFLNYYCFLKFTGKGDYKYRLQKHKEEYWNNVKSFLFFVSWCRKMLFFYDACEFLVDKIEKPLPSSFSALQDSLGPFFTGSQTQQVMVV